MADLQNLIGAAEAQYGLPPGLLGRLLTKGEASGERAVSPKGAAGVAQLMPGTARDLGVTDRFDSTQSVDGGARYLRQQLDTFGDPKLAVAAYNAGPGAVKKYGGVPPYRETQKYVGRVMGDTAPAAGFDGADIFGTPPKAIKPYRVAQGEKVTGGGDFDGSDIFAPPAVTPVPVRRPKPATPVNPAMADAQRREASVSPRELAIAQGATVGFGDDIDAFLARGETLGTNALKRLTGAPLPYTSKQASDAVLAVNKTKETKFGREHPVQNFALNFVGGLALPGGKFIKGAGSLPGAIGRSAVVGGAYGAAQGVGEAEGNLKQRLPAAIPGAIAGATIGAAIPPAARGAVVAAKGVASIPRRLATRFTPEAIRAARLVQQQTDQAVRYVDGLVQSTKAPANQLEAASTHLTAAEAIGKPAEIGLAALARRSGVTGEAAQSVFRQRAQAMPERVLNQLEAASGLHPEAVGGDFASLAAKLRQDAGPLYDHAYNAAAPRNGIRTDKLENLVKRPSMKGAIARAISIAQEEGRDPKALGLFNLTRVEKNRPGSADVGQVNRKRLTDALTTQSWDYVKRGLDDTLETYRNPVTGRLNLDERGRAILGTLNELRTELTTQNPAYKMALEVGGEPLRLEEAYRLAPKLVSNATPEAVFTKRFESFSPAQREAFKGGFVNSVYEAVRAGRLRPRDMESPAFATKLRTVLGPEGATSFLHSAQLESRMLASGRRISPGNGSPTAELTEAMAAQDGKGSVLREIGADLATGAVSGHGVRGTLTQTIAKQGSRMASVIRTPGMSAQVRDKAGELLLLKPEELAALLRASPIKAGSKTPLISPYLVPALSEAGSRTDR